MKKNAMVFVSLLVLMASMLSTPVLATVADPIPEVPVVTETPVPAETAPPPVIPPVEGTESPADPAIPPEDPAIPPEDPAIPTVDPNAPAEGGNGEAEPENLYPSVEFYPEEDDTRVVMFLTKNEEGVWEVTQENYYSSVWPYVAMAALLILVVFAAIVVVNLIIIKIYRTYN